MFVFGASLEDAGNVLRLYGQTQQTPEPVPTFPYEGGRYTNGKVWVEILAEALKMPRGGRPALAGRKNHNYAFGFAQVSGEGPLAVPDFAGQIDMLLDKRRRLPPRGLYVVSFGG